MLAVGELRTSAEARLAVKAAHTGRLVQAEISTTATGGWAERYTLQR